MSNKQVFDIFALFNIFGGSGVPLIWILATGFWNDSGGWDDTALWID